MPLSVSLGHASLIGPRQRNEDFCGAATPEGAELEAKGLVAAIADGVGGHASGREASEYTVRGLLSDYYATPDTWGVPTALDTVLQALNRWLIAHAARSPDSAGMATTLSAIVLRGRRYYVAHVGDSRIYRLRGDALQQLTTDHVWEHPELSNVLKRAIGLDAHLAVDYSDGELAPGDAFLLATDGVWNTLGECRLHDMLARGSDPQQTAEELAAAAIESGAADNCSALVLRVATVPEQNLRDSLSNGRKQPLPPRLKAGQEIDELRVETLLHESRVTLLYRVRDKTSGQPLVLKTLRPEAGDDENTTALLHEEWLARRVTSHYFPQVVSHAQRDHLYYLMTWHDGATLKQRLDRGHRFTCAGAVQIGLRLCKGIGALHRLGIIHRDIKPDNLHAGSDGRLRILDLGVAASDGNEFNEINNPGTPSFMAPERFDGEPATESADFYAAGVTLYHLLTRKYPYGEVEPFQHPKFGDPISPTRYRPDIPDWLEAVLLKAVARDKQERFETAEEFLLALEQGANRPLRVPRRMPLAQRSPRLMLGALLVVSLLLNFALAWLLIRR